MIRSQLPRRRQGSVASYFRQFAPRATLSLVLWLLVLVFLMPLLVIAFTSVKPDSETMGYPPTILPHTLTAQPYFDVFKILPFGQFFMNTVRVSAVSSLLTVLLSATAAYSMTRFRFFATDVMSAFGLAAYMLPGILVILPVLKIVFAFHALDSTTALIVVYTAYFLPFSMWQLRSYFAGIPRELEDAALVDGATRLEAFFLIVLPQALPGLIATWILAFSVAWNEYLFASLILYTPANQTLSAGISHVLVGQLDLYSWGDLMAAAVLMTVPVVLVFVFLQRGLVTGLGGGAVKG